QSVGPSGTRARGRSAPRGGPDAGGAAGGRAAPLPDAPRPGRAPDRGEAHGRHGLLPRAGAEVGVPPRGGDLPVARRGRVEARGRGALRAAGLPDLARSEPRRGRPALGRPDPRAPPEAPRAADPEDRRGGPRARRRPPALRVRPYPGDRV